MSPAGPIKKKQEGKEAKAFHKKIGKIGERPKHSEGMKRGSSQSKKKGRLSQEGVHW